MALLDSKANQYESWLPYNYVMNNPIKAIDPDGSEIRVITDDDKNLVARNAKLQKGILGMPNVFNQIDAAKDIVIYVITTRMPIFWH